MGEGAASAAFPPAVRHELGGWVLWWADLEVRPGVQEALAAVRAAVAARARASHTAHALAEHPTAAAVRRLFRQAGCDPTRHRPSSEALLRRVLKGEELPAIHPLVDLNNCLSVELVVPACVMSCGAATPPFELRAGRPGESMLSMRGPYELHGKPLLADSAGPFGTPITDSERVRVGPETTRTWLVAYLPAGTLDRQCAIVALSELLSAAPVAAILAEASSGG
ncbi:MAG TPA: phenylalanine--tRNA ligase beta subunit-related protein [Thermoanaerobaculaceae bacterium]|nr:phenylalanine--tRNA ligase beta subunit-related protein [Thermoanaerobaculaceae bacterium]